MDRVAILSRRDAQFEQPGWLAPSGWNQGVSSTRLNMIARLA
jgi:hypothetical protein